MELNEKIAAAIVSAMRQSDDGAWIGTHGKEEDDLKELTIDGTFDMLSVADAALNVGYEAAYAEGGSNNFADFQFAFSEYLETPDGKEIDFDGPMDLVRKLNKIIADNHPQRHCG